MPREHQPQPGPVPIGDVIEKTLSGIAKAQKDYEDWSGGYWLWMAPEYMLTMYIAQAIRTIPGSHFLTLEEGVKKSMEEAGGFGRGKLPKSVRPYGKSDITLWWGKGEPRAVIEVKKHVSTFKKIEADIERISAMLKNKDNSLQCGLVALYTSRQDGYGNGCRAASTIKERLETMEDEARSFLASKRCSLSLSRHDSDGGIEIDDDSAWVASVLKVQHMS